MLDWIKEIIYQIWHYLLPFTVVNEYELGVRLRFGIHPKLLKSGFHFKIPFIDNVLTCIVTEDTRSCKPIHITTTDGKTISATPVIKYIIEDAVHWLIYTNDAMSNLEDITRLVSSDYLTDIEWEECKQKPTWTKIKNKLNSKVESMGAKISEFGLANMCISRVIITQL